MERYFITTGKSKIHVTEWGNENNPVIFCLHGLGSTSLSFIEIAEQLKDDYRIVAIDSPGHGKTSPFEHAEEYEMYSLVDWIHNILKQLGIDQFYFLSHSWGSSIALFYIKKYQTKVKSTILIDGGYQTKRSQDQTMEEEAAFYRRDFDEYVFNDWVSFIKSEKEAYTRWSPLLERAVMDLGIEKDNKVHWHTSGITANHIIKAMYKDETEDVYEDLSPNIILLRATLPKSWDEYRSKTSTIFTQKTGGIVKQVPNTTHMLHWDKPEVVVEEIQKNWV
ncbi:alpha/beta hydrolase [Alkalihalobacillus sp. AL-G]|uniref:alpha/beta hydrolase n=1 Tax=Alkalihalobacillus sp. AL-G TaxID=2926399 RepID=UPI00272D4A95|nr:alpha/beta hydrolase [Alkalihalobacillus sp. AL-G]WLD94633.1 alpha/beta hydrolase [Alkalihalobacillus sp. AL-G]